MLAIYSAMELRRRNLRDDALESRTFSGMDQRGIIPIKTLHNSANEKVKA